MQKLLVDRAAEVGRVDRLLADPLTGGAVNRNCSTWSGPFAVHDVGEARTAPRARLLPGSNLDLVGLPDREIAAVGPGNRPLDQEQIVFDIDSHDLEGCGRSPGHCPSARACGCPSGFEPDRHSDRTSPGDGAFA